MRGGRENSAPGKVPGARVAVQDRVLAVLVLVVTGLFWAESANIRADEARMYPRMILLALFGLGIILAARSLREDKTKRAGAVVPSVSAFATFILASIVYVASVSTLGFFTASALYMPAVAYLLGLRRHLMNAAITALFLVATYIVFVIVFSRPLPREIFWG